MFSYRVSLFPVSLRAQCSMPDTSNEQIWSTNFLVYPIAVVSTLDIHWKQCWEEDKTGVVTRQTLTS